MIYNSQLHAYNQMMALRTTSRFSRKRSNPSMLEYNLKDYNYLANSKSYNLERAWFGNTILHDDRQQISVPGRTQNILFLQGLFYKKYYLIYYGLRFCMKYNLKLHSKIKKKVPLEPYFKFYYYASLNFQYNVNDLVCSVNLMFLLLNSLIFTFVIFDIG